MKKLLLTLFMLSFFVGFSQQRVDISYKPFYIINDLYLDTLDNGTPFLDSTFIVKIPSSGNKLVLQSIGYSIEDTVSIVVQGAIDIDSISSYSTIETVYLESDGMSYLDIECIYPYIIGTINSISADTTNSGHVDILMQVFRKYKD